MRGKQPLPYCVQHPRSVLSFLDALGEAPPVDPVGPRGHLPEAAVRSIPPVAAPPTRARQKDSFPRSASLLFIWKLCFLIYFQPNSCFFKFLIFLILSVNECPQRGRSEPEFGLVHLPATHSGHRRIHRTCSRIAGVNKSAIRACPRSLGCMPSKSRSSTDFPGTIPYFRKAVSTSTSPVPSSRANRRITSR